MKYIKNFKIFENSNHSENLNVQNILNSYLNCAIWCMDEDEKVDSDFSIEDIDDESVEKATIDIVKFIHKAKPYLNNLTDSQIGNDFWLTRNHHGTGFWDRKEIDSEIGEILSDISHEFKEINIYVGDNGKIYIE